MANDTIASGGTFTLGQPLTGGTNIDFLNNAGDSGVLNVQPAALRITTLVNGGTASLVSAAIGGDILNFQPGDLMTLQNLPSFYSELDFAPDAAAQNVTFADQITFAAEGDVQFFIEPDGSVVSSLNQVTLDANAVAIIDDLRDGLFGTAAAGATLTLSLAERPNPNSNHPFIDGVISAGVAINPCFAAGTRILTVQGEVAVETLRIGDEVVTFAGEEAAILWIGTREIDIARHPCPESVQPVIIEPEALGAGVPARRLTVSPDHGLLIDGVLVPAKDLTNRGSIRQDTAVKRIRYYHVELAAHDVLVADGAPVESFLDTGHRGVFDNADEPLLLHPDLMQLRRGAESCVPLCGAVQLAVIRTRLARRQRSVAGGQRPVASKADH